MILETSEIEAEKQLVLISYSGGSVELNNSADIYVKFSVDEWAFQVEAKLKWQNDCNCQLMVFLSLSEKPLVTVTPKTDREKWPLFHW